MDDIIPQKRCNRCLQLFPATTQYFDTLKSKYLRNTCKECRKARKREIWAVKHPQDILPEGQKRCTHCKQVKPATKQYFYANKGMPDKLNYWCKECRKAWGEEHPNLDYSPSNRREYYLAHKQEVNEWTRIYLQTEAGKANRKRYRQRHTEQINARTRAHRARKKDVPGTHTAQDIKDQYKRQKGKCYYCQKKVKWGDHEVDHTFPTSRENARNSIDHLVITCRPCNASKSNKYPWEWPEGGRLL